VTSEFSIDSDFCKRNSVIALLNYVITDIHGVTELVGAGMVIPQGHFLEKGV
jgi:hypothetical protein